MALNKQEGVNQARDNVAQRLGSGTLGNDVVQTGGITGRKASAVIDDSDSRIRYGVYTPSSTTGLAGYDPMGSVSVVSGGTQTVIGGLAGAGLAGSAGVFKFNGGFIAVLGATTPNSGTMRVYIDGVETAGRVPITVAQRIQANSPNITLQTTTIPSFSPNNFSSVGTILIDAELITYTSWDGNGFYGCVRGALGSTATEHNASATIYQWTSVIGLYAPANSTKQILYYNPFLAPGNHSIIIVAETNSTSGVSRIFFDGFIVGSLLGNRNILTQTSNIVLSYTLDANGHAECGYLTTLNPDIFIIGNLGSTQTGAGSTETSNATQLTKVGLRWSADNQPYLYLHNGPPSTSVVVIITLVTIGESL